MSEPTGQRSIPRAGLRSMMRADAVEELTSTVQPSPTQAPSANVRAEDDNEVFDPSQESLHRSLPRNSALLAVTEDPEPGHFRLGFFFDGRYEESRVADVRDQRTIDLTLHRIAERRKWKNDHDELKNWWRELARLRRWMDRLAGAAETRLIVWDNTSYQLPWELYHLGERPGGPPSGWLGARVEVVRWTSLLESGRETRYTAVPTQVSGGVVALETEDITDRGDGVSAMVERYRPRRLTNRRGPMRTMESLLSELRNEDLSFALLLVHCLGINARNANEFRLAERTLNELEDASMIALAKSQAVVILNACNTAKLVPVGPHAARATRSFAEMFLRKGASSVVATLGQVGLDHTREFTFRLLEAPGAQRISKLLLEHRKRYAARLAEVDRGDARYEEFFYCFMYVCFGDPETTLEITETAPDGAG